jgi:hypothetical protein
MPSRASRRRRERQSEPPGRSIEPLVRSRDVLIVAVAGGALIAGLLVFLLLSRGGGGENAPPAPEDASPALEDQQAIESLAKESIDALASGRWPSLFDSFTPEFQQRCPRADFEAAGRADANAQGERLSRLRFVRLEEVSLTGESATAVIVGEITGETEYRVRGAFQRVDGAWKLAPAANTSGCSAFDRIE